MDGRRLIMGFGVKGVLEAIDYETGKIRWSHFLGPGGSDAGVLTTDSGLTFTGDSFGNVLALDTRDGKTLWHAGTGDDIESSPIAYETGWTRIRDDQQRWSLVCVGASGCVS